MGQNADGTANCDRCTITLPGMGVLHGLVCVDVDPSTGATREFIFCYELDCRTVMLDGTVDFLDVTQPTRCAECGVTVARSISTAMLATDISPDDPGTFRQMTFCYADGSRDRLLAKAQQ